MNKIDPTKKYFTRDGREVKDLHVQEDGQYVTGELDGIFRVWDIFGKHIIHSSLDLVPDEDASN